MKIIVLTEEVWRHPIEVAGSLPEVKARPQAVVRLRVVWHWVGPAGPWLGGVPPIWLGAAPSLGGALPCPGAW